MPAPSAGQQRQILPAEQELQHPPNSTHSSATQPRCVSPPFEQTRCSCSRAPAAGTSPMTGMQRISHPSAGNGEECSHGQHRRPKYTVGNMTIDPATNTPKSQAHHLHSVLLRLCDAPTEIFVPSTGPKLIRHRSEHAEALRPYQCIAPITHTSGQYCRWQADGLPKHTQSKRLLRAYDHSFGIEICKNFCVHSESCQCRSSSPRTHCEQTRFLPRWHGEGSPCCTAGNRQKEGNKGLSEA